MMDTHLNNKRIWIFLAIAIGIPWTAALVLYLTLGQTDLFTAGALANLIFITTPALANVATRLVTREGWKRLWLWPKFRRGWPFYLAAILLPFLAAIVGAAIFYLVFPGNFDPNLGALRKYYEPYSVAPETNPWVALLIITLTASIGWLYKNGLASIGEEFGWRAYLLPKLMRRFTGEELVPGSSPNADGSLYAAAVRKASLLIGLIWGVWHFPLIIMSFSIDPSMTLMRALAFLGLYVVSTCAMSVLLCWVTLRSGSVWTASIGHGFLNGTTALPPMALQGTANSLLGPGLPGLLGLLGYLGLALVLLFHRNAFGRKEEAGSPKVQLEYSTLVE
jgi:membrane protease YdiL (CAAX protease family)